MLLLLRLSYSPRHRCLAIYTLRPGATIQRAAIVESDAVGHLEIGRLVIFIAVRVGNHSATCKAHRPLLPGLEMPSTPTAAA